jgi:hypothetical protein
MTKSYLVGRQYSSDTRSSHGDGNMIHATRNPFDITKASEFNDEQIAAYFVDIPSPGFVALANPRSPMPMLIKGGKGSGKTHLMRYYSFPLQKLRHSKDVLEGIKKEGYLGVYFRCGGLNATRFKGKGQSPEVWEAIFAYYMELWLAQLLLNCLSEIFPTSTSGAKVELLIVHECISLLDDVDRPSARTLRALSDYFHSLQRELDVQVNNAALTRTLAVRIKATSGRLVFGIPKILGERLSELRDIQFLYLLDEYENLTEQQQRYVNTLLREKELPTSFKIGGRIYGFKTFKTYSDQEEIKEGSEYKVLSLDARLREAEGQYRTFAEHLCATRLIQAGYMGANTLDVKEAVPLLSEAFETYDQSPLFSEETSFVKEKYSARERPYFTKLRKRLSEGISGSSSPGVVGESEIKEVIANLRLPNFPILEKANIFRLYQNWRSSGNLVESSKEIRKQANAFLDGDGSGDYANMFEKRKGDLLAQLLRDCDQKQQYLGIDTFIDMSSGLPRNLLVILKSIFNWASFNGEDPFRGGKVSAASQREGVREAAEWFFDDARMPGGDGAAIRTGVNRLATLFREVRYSDKPSEKSICTFSVDLSQCSIEAQNIIRLAEKWSLLISVSGGQRDRNTMRVDEKFYLNAMLAPKWDLPVSRGGALALNPGEVNAIFDQAFADQFDQVVRERVEPMAAPFFGSKRRNATSQDSDQQTLPLENENA